MAQNYFKSESRIVLSAISMILPKIIHPVSNFNVVVVVVLNCISYISNPVLGKFNQIFKGEPVLRITRVT
jgi:hypothetical protein